MSVDYSTLDEETLGKEPREINYVYDAINAIADGLKDRDIDALLYVQRTIEGWISHRDDRDALLEMIEQASEVVYELKENSVF